MLWVGVPQGIKQQQSWCILCYMRPHMVHMGRCNGGSAPNSLWTACSSGVHFFSRGQKSATIPTRQHVSMCLTRHPCSVLSTSGWPCALPPFVPRRPGGLCDLPHPGAAVRHGVHDHVKQPDLAQLHLHPTTPEEVRPAASER